MGKAAQEVGKVEWAMAKIAAAKPHERAKLEGIDTWARRMKLTYESQRRIHAAVVARLEAEAADEGEHFGDEWAARLASPPDCE